MTKETYSNPIGVLNKAVGNGNAAVLLERIVFWNTRPKGGVSYQGRTWSYRSQKEWIELAGLKERTGKRCWAHLAKSGFILTEMRMGGPLGNRKLMMHVALSDKTYDLLGGTHLAMAAAKAELAINHHAKTAQKAKAWTEMHAEIHAGEDE
jgi:hypothetical protein